MDFNRNNSGAPAARPAQPVGSSESFSGNNRPSGKSRKKVSFIKIGAFALLLCLVGIVVALVLLISFGDSSESKAIKQDKLQSVFLNNGQVYFGNIKTLNSKYVDLTNIYYLRTNSASATAATQANSANDVSLVKLGCELHGPYDEMIINRDQVTFWENLQDTGQVAKVIAQYKTQDPNGQKCSTTTNAGTQQTPAATTPSNTSGTTKATP